MLCQAALTELRNLPTSSLRRLLSPDSDCAAERTSDEADPVSPAPRCTSVMFEHISDAGSSFRQFADAVIGFLRLIHRLVGDAGGFLDLAADFIDRRGHLL